MNHPTSEELRHKASLLEDSLLEAGWDLESAEASLANARTRVHSLTGELAHINNILSDRELLTKCDERGMIVVSDDKGIE